jgi:hypothetical protein
LPPSGIPASTAGNKQRSTPSAGAANRATAPGSFGGLTANGRLPPRSPRTPPPARPCVTRALVECGIPWRRWKASWLPREVSGAPAPAAASAAARRRTVNSRQRSPRTPAQARPSVPPARLERAATSHGAAEGRRGRRAGTGLRRGARPHALDAACPRLLGGARAPGAIRGAAPGAAHKVDPGGRTPARRRQVANSARRELPTVRCARPAARRST